jgi:hypothetical protein
MNLTYKTKRLGYKNDARVPYACAGWNDAAHGLPIDYKLLDRAPSPACAQSYEMARLRVLALRMAGLPVPNWRSARAVPPAIHAAITLTNSFNSMARAEGAGFWPTGSKYWREAA